MDDARWVGSDGCNVTSGHWAVGPEGLSLIGDGGATQRGCLEPAQDWVVDARRAVLDDGALTLFDAAGKRTGRLQRAR